MDPKYFVTVIAADRAALVRLADFKLDLFHTTAAMTERRTVRLAADRTAGKAAAYREAGPADVVQDTSIDGLVTLEQVGRLVAAGYQVLVRDPASARSRASQTMDVQDWLKAVLEG